MAERIAAQRIGGVSAEGTSGDDFHVVNPADGSVVATLELASPADVNAAVEAAVHAQKEWGSATPAERSAALHRLAGILEAKAEEYAQTETLQTGKPIKLSREFDVPGSIDNVAYFAGA
ncbi:MAG: aldehyde dehydrogenase family protein, partial [Actinomycetes bacterium]